MTPPRNTHPDLVDSTQDGINLELTISPASTISPSEVGKLVAHHVTTLVGAYSQSGSTVQIRLQIGSHGDVSSDTIQESADIEPQRYFDALQRAENLQLADKVLLALGYLEGIGEEKIDNRRINNLIEQATGGRIEHITTAVNPNAPRYIAKDGKFRHLTKVGKAKLTREILPHVEDQSES